MFMLNFIRQRIGGLNVYTPVLAQYLVPPLPAEPLVSHLRMVDKYLVDPPTTCLPKAFLKTLQDRGDVIEYRQGNLAIPGESTWPLE